MRYQCPRCERIYDEMTQDGMCEDGRKCLGVELVEYTEPGVQPVPPFPSVGVIEGLCLLVCDISYSMSEPAFAGREITKLELVTQAIESALVELYRISKPDEAFVGIIAFGARAALIRDRQNRPFLLPLSQIEQEFGNNGLKPYLLDCFQTDAPGVGRKHTDITAALRLARTMYDDAVAGDLSKFGAGGVKIMKHKDIVAHDESRISVPNVRILLYSDGQHNPEIEDPLVKPFEDVHPSPLMTAFLGDESKDTESRQGADQVMALANRCITHKKSGVFFDQQSIQGRRAS